MPPHNRVQPHERHFREENLPINGRKNERGSIILTSLAISSIFTAVLAGLLLLAALPLSVVIPSAAPVWMGIAALVNTTK